MEVEPSPCLFPVYNHQLFTVYITLAHSTSPAGRLGIHCQSLHGGASIPARNGKHIKQYRPMTRSDGGCMDACMQRGTFRRWWVQTPAQ